MDPFEHTSAAGQAVLSKELAAELADSAEECMALNSGYPRLPYSSFDSMEPLIVQREVESKKREWQAIAEIGGHETPEEQVD
jgi:hypothetical protein